MYLVNCSTICNQLGVAVHHSKPERFVKKVGFQFLFFLFFLCGFFIVFCFPQVCRALRCCPKWTRATACPDPQGALLAAPTLSTKLWRSAGSAVPSSDPLLLTCTVSLMTTSSTLSPTTRVLTIERRVCESLGQVCVHPVMQSKTCHWAPFFQFFFWLCSR